MPAEFRDVSFGPAVGGYNRKQVDAYVERVNRLIAELEISRSPEKARRCSASTGAAAVTVSTALYTRR